MRHLIILLGHSTLRIQHPVYRRFAQIPLTHRNTSLLFLQRQPDERELVHEVERLRSRDEAADEGLTFHVCSLLTQAVAGQHVVQAVMMIQRRYAGSSLYVYGCYPEPDRCTTAQRKAVWQSLTQINACVTNYPDLRLVSRCYLYHDESHASLAEFLYMYTQEPRVAAQLASLDYTPAETPSEMPDVFGTFNARSITYPESEVRHHLRLSYLEAVLGLSRPDTNPIDISCCNTHVEAIIRQMPLGTTQLTLQGESFIALPQLRNSGHWQPAKAYWQQQSIEASQQVQQQSHDQWLHWMDSRMANAYATKFRQQGVENFYAEHLAHLALYRDILFQQIRQDIHDTLRRNPYPPETAFDLVRSLINRLQQLSMLFTQQQSQHEADIARLEAELAADHQAWDSMGFIGKLRGRDKALLAEHQQRLTALYEARTARQGAAFAERLLNELIPQVYALVTPESHEGQRCQLTLDHIRRIMSCCPPDEFMPATFGMEPLLEAVRVLTSDRSLLTADYAVLQSLLYPAEADRTPASSSVSHDEDGDDDTLLQELRDRLDAVIDRRIDDLLVDGQFPPVLQQTVLQRLSTLYADRGGLDTLVAQLQKETALSLALKGKGGQNEQYLLVSPDGEGWAVDHITSADTQSVQMLHVLAGISLTDLDGFAGQRMFVEPSMF